MGWLKRHLKVTEMCEDSELIPIGLPHDGEYLTAPDAESAAEVLEYLKKVGYNVPQYAIDALHDEANERDVENG